MKNHLGVALLTLFLAMLACRPVFAIGWEEFLVLGFLFFLLIGPPLYRFFRTFERHRSKKGK